MNQLHWESYFVDKPFACQRFVETAVTLLWYLIETESKVRVGWECRLQRDLLTM